MKKNEEKKAINAAQETDMNTDCSSELLNCNRVKLLVCDKASAENPAHRKSAKRIRRPEPAREL